MMSVSESFPRDGSNTMILFSSFILFFFISCWEKEEHVLDNFSLIL